MGIMKINLLFYAFMVSLLVIFFVSMVNGQWSMVSYAEDEIDVIGRQIEELQKAKQLSEEATKPLEAELNKLNAKLQNTQALIDQAKKNLIILQLNIEQREKDFDVQYQLLARNVEQYYKKLRAPSAFYFLLSSQTASNLVKEIFYGLAVSDDQKNLIAKITKEILNLEKDKKKVELDQKRLAAWQVQLDEQASFFRKEVKGAKDYQAVLSRQIAQLSAKQKELIAKKLSSLNLPSSLGAGPLYCIDDRKLDPGFSPAFAFFTYGIPHRVGMNQYGAYGRAKTGQNYQDILRAYFQNISFEKRDNIQIKVQGYGQMSLEDYLLGIYEMPLDWPLEAQKAQAVAARSYALAYTNNGQNEICTTQACQVYKGGNKGGDWEQAVRATSGEVMVSGGQVITAWYASTSGGYTFTSADVWGSDRPWTKRMRDTAGEIGGFGDLQSQAYDKDSPCFYSAQGYRSQYNKSAWLKSEEVADIVNVILMARKDQSVQDHLYQTDKPHPYGGEIWDESRVKEELRKNKITPFNAITNISVDDWDKNLGRTNNITFSGDAGSVTIGGSEFKDFFNLRAPSNIQIVGPLYNVERR
jgi:SpoIID/LytB domain protein